MTFLFQSSSLVSDIGGQLGLWLGLSIIAIAEFVEFVYVLSTILFKCKRPKQGSKVTSAPTSLARLDYG